MAEQGIQLLSFFHYQSCQATSKKPWRTKTTEVRVVAILVSVVQETLMSWVSLVDLCAKYTWLVTMTGTSKCLTARPKSS